MINARHKKRRWCDFFRKNKLENVHPEVGETDQRLQRDPRIDRDEEIAIRLQNQYFSNQNLQVVEQPIITITIDSKIPTEDVKFMDFAPSNEQDKFTYRYNCPICLRYFNYMLVGKWWGNYLWHFWANDFIKMAQKNKDFSSKWPLCNNNEFHLEDVNLCDEIKRYGNTFLNPSELANAENKFIHTKNENFVPLNNFDSESVAKNIKPLR